MITPDDRYTKDTIAYQVLTPTTFYCVWVFQEVGKPGWYLRFTKKDRYNNNLSLNFPTQADAEKAMMALAHALDTLP